MVESFQEILDGIADDDVGIACYSIQIVNFNTGGRTGENDESLGRIIDTSNFSADYRIFNGGSGTPIGYLVSNLRRIGIKTVQKFPGSSDERIRRVGVIKIV